MDIFICMWLRKCFRLYSLAGLLHVEPSLLPGVYSATKHRITCRGGAFYKCHHCLLLSTHSHLCGVGVLGWPGRVNEGPLRFPQTSPVREVWIRPLGLKLFCRWWEIIKSVQTIKDWINWKIHLHVEKGASLGSSDINILGITKTYSWHWISHMYEYVRRLKLDLLHVVIYT